MAALPTSAPGQEALLGLGRSETEPEGPARSIAPTSSPSEDRALHKRLTEIYAQVDGLESVEIDVRAGVVRLSGEVFSGAAHQRAVRIANQLQGVVEVQDEIAESRDLERRLWPVVDDLHGRLLNFVAGVPLFLVSLIVFGLVLLLGQLLTRWEAPFRHLTRNPFARDLARQAVRVVFFLAGAVIALEILDATALVATVAGIAGLAGLAVSFAFRDLAENYIASVLLSLRQPFQADDQVVIAGHEGRVVRLNSRATILMDLDGNHVRIPNAGVYKGIIVNYTRNPERRFGFTVGVAPDTDLLRALELGIASLERMPGILAEPSAAGWLDRLGDWCSVLCFSAWIDQRRTDWFKARGEAMRVVKEAFDRAGIVMPEPTVIVAEGHGAESTRAETAAEGAALPTPAGVDISRDTQLETAVAEDRAAGGVDFLDPSRPTE